MEIEELYEAYRVCRKHNRRSRDMALFEMSLYGRLVLLCDAVNSRTYTPSANYTFIHYRPKPREVFAAEPELKVLMCYVDMRINRLVDKNLIPRVFNNRVGKGTHAAVNQVIEDIYECSKGFTNNDCWIIKYDLKGYFPNLNQDRAYSFVSELITKELPESEADEMLYLVERICYCNPQERCEKRSQPHEWSTISPYKSLFSKPFGTGGAIGFLFWQIMSNFYLHKVDKWIVENITPYYTRFVDDMVMITDNKECALAMLRELRTRLKSIDVELHPHKFYCQHCTKGLEFLGYHIKRNRIHVNAKISERAYKAVCRSHRINYVESVNSYFGIIKSCGETDLLKMMMDRIPNKYEKDFVKWKIKEIA